MSAARFVRIAAAVAVAATAAPALHAQATLDTVVIAAPGTRADSLDRKAEALYGSPKTWRQAAYLHQISASLRPMEDMRGVRSLTMAANLFYALGDGPSARSAMETAANYAAWRGEIAQAALAYVDAGYMALELGNRGKANQLGLKAQHFAQSPLLTETQRSEINRRLGGEGRAVALLTP
jgi:hypothetical protein